MGVRDRQTADLVDGIRERLPVVEFAGGTDMIQKGDTVQIDFEKGIVLHKATSYPFPALPKEVLAVLNDGGLIPHVKKALGKTQVQSASQVL